MEILSLLETQDLYIDSQTYEQRQAKGKAKTCLSLLTFKFLQVF